MPKSVAEKRSEAIATFKREVGPEGGIIGTDPALRAIAQRAGLFGGSYYCVIKTKEEKQHDGDKQTVVVVDFPAGYEALSQSQKSLLAAFDLVTFIDSLTATFNSFGGTAKLAPHANYIYDYLYKMFEILGAYREDEYGVYDYLYRKPETMNKLSRYTTDGIPAVADDDEHKAQRIKQACEQLLVFMSTLVNDELLSDLKAFGNDLAAPILLDLKPRLRAIMQELLHQMVTTEKLAEQKGDAVGMGGVGAHERYKMPQVTVIVKPDLRDSQGKPQEEYAPTRDFFHVEHMEKYSGGFVDFLAGCKLVVLNMLALRDGDKYLGTDAKAVAEQGQVEEYGDKYEVMLNVARGLQAALKNKGNLPFCKIYSEFEAYCADPFFLRFVAEFNCLNKLPMPRDINELKSSLAARVFHQEMAKQIALTTELTDVSQAIFGHDRCATPEAFIEQVMFFMIEGRVRNLRPELKVAGAEEKAYAQMNSEEKIAALKAAEQTILAYRQQWSDLGAEAAVQAFDAQALGLDLHALGEAGAVEATCRQGETRARALLIIDAHLEALRAHVQSEEELQAAGNADVLRAQLEQARGRAVELGGDPEQKELGKIAECKAEYDGMGIDIDIEVNRVDTTYNALKSITTCNSQISQAQALLRYLNNYRHGGQLPFKDAEYARLLSAFISDCDDEWPDRLDYCKPENYQKQTKAGYGVFYTLSFVTESADYTSNKFLCAFVEERIAELQSIKHEEYEQVQYLFTEEAESGHSERVAQLLAEEGEKLGRAHIKKSDKYRKGVELAGMQREYEQVRANIRKLETHLQLIAYREEAATLVGEYDALRQAIAAVQAADGALALQNEVPAPEQEAKAAEFAVPDLQALAAAGADDAQAPHQPEARHEAVVQRPVLWKEIHADQLELKRQALKVAYQHLRDNFMRLVGEIHDINSRIPDVKHQIDLKPAEIANILGLKDLEEGNAAQEGMDALIQGLDQACQDREAAIQAEKAAEHLRSSTASRIKRSITSFDPLKYDNAEAAKQALAHTVEALEAVKQDPRYAHAGFTEQTKAEVERAIAEAKEQSPLVERCDRAFQVKGALSALQSYVDAAPAPGFRFFPDIFFGISYYIRTSRWDACAKHVQATIAAVNTWIKSGTDGDKQQVVALVLQGQSSFGETVSELLGAVTAAIDPQPLAAGHDYDGYVMVEADDADVAHVVHVADDADDAEHKAQPEERHQRPQSQAEAAFAGSVVGVLRALPRDAGEFKVEEDVHDSARSFASMIRQRIRESVLNGAWSSKAEVLEFQQFEHGKRGHKIYSMVCPTQVVELYEYLRDYEDGKYSLIDRDKFSELWLACPQLDELGDEDDWDDDFDFSQEVLDAILEEHANLFTKPCDVPQYVKRDDEQQPDRVAAARMGAAAAHL